MIGARDLTVYSATPLPALREQALRVEKPNHSSNLKQQAGPSTSDAQHEWNSRARTRVSQSDTSSHVPLWYGPRLRSAFVAQVMGQVYVSNGVQSARAPAGYRTSGIPAGLLVDETV